MNGIRDGPLVTAPQIALSRWSAHEGRRQPLTATGPSILIIIEGEGRIAGEGFEGVRFAKGNTLFIPADLKGQQLDPETDCRWLEVTSPT